MVVFGAVASALLAYLLTRSSYLTRIAAAEAVVAQLTKQLAERAGELAELRNKLASEARARAEADTALIQERKSLAEQRQTLSDAENKLSTVFEGLAAKVLASSTTNFLGLANESLKNGAVKDLQNLVTPIEQTLTEYKTQLEAIERSRLTAFSEIKTTLASVGSTQDTLKKETSNLVNALRRPNVRGRWGELTLRRVAELTGMSERCDFDLQAHVEGEDGDVRPDMIVHLPKNMIVPVDSKVPLDAYLDAIGAVSAEDQKRHFKRHAEALRSCIRSLSSKEYQTQFPVTPDVTVLFLPSDAFLSAALEHDPTLLEDAMQKKVVIATPPSLFCLLKAVFYGWQQESIAENAQTIRDLGQLLYERIQVFSGHLSELRKGLVKATKGFDDAVGSLDLRVIPAARKFKELGAATGAELEDIELIAHEPRALSISTIEVKTDG